MKKVYLVLQSLVVPFLLNAQTLVNDSVTMNTGYTQDIFYNLYNGSKTSVDIKNWDLAFTTNAMEVGIRINSINGVNVWAVPAIDTLGWSTLDSAGYQSWQELHNTDTSMYYGAFNNNANGSQFDFSWGAYDFNTHEVIGDSLFLIKVTDLSNAVYFKKLWIIKRANNTTHDWVFRYANLDNTGDITVTIPSTNYSTKNLVYYSIINGNIIDREPAKTDWDILFTRYTTDVGGGYYYPVAGVYSNYGVQVVDVRSVDVAATTSDAPYLNLYNTRMDEIGYDWKAFNMTLNIWEVEDSLVYFVRTNAGEVYKLVMTGFEGSLTGNIFFNKTLVSTTGINEGVSSLKSLNVYPNPAHDQLNVFVNSGQNQLMSFNLVDMFGKQVKTGSLAVISGLNKWNINTSSLPGGLYVLELNSGKDIQKQKVLIQ